MGRPLPWNCEKPALKATRVSEQFDPGGSVRRVIATINWIGMACVRGCQLGIIRENAYALSANRKGEVIGTWMWRAELARVRARAQRPAGNAHRVCSAQACTRARYTACCEVVNDSFCLDACGCGILESCGARDRRGGSRGGLPILEQGLADERASGRAAKASARVRAPAPVTAVCRHSGLDQCTFATGYTAYPTPPGHVLWHMAPWRCSTVASRPGTYGGK